MPDIVSIGEALIDFLAIDKEVVLEDTRGFTVAPGGAPANVAAAIAKLGGSSGFVGKVGNDAFGRKIQSTLQSAGVNTDFLLLDEKVNTTLAFIAVKKNKEPDFMFFRNHCGADLALRQDELDEGYIYECKILHFGSISLTDEPLKSTILKTIEIARRANRIISYDPNLRPSLWDSMQHAKTEITSGLEYADIVKLTDTELEFITGTKSLSRGTDMILKSGPRIAMVTRGKDSCFFNDGNTAVELPVFEVESVDTTGAGDAFNGGFLLGILERIRKDQSICNMEKNEVSNLIRFANACGAITVTRKGVIPALPTLDEVNTFLRKRK
ncbi:MAG: carbohydrate kinase [Spirochaetota bacterium]|nr:MAG: carbohydrate kinase [Spirochaetota bacterium]